MFFEVKIFDADGELQRVVSPKKLSNKFWKENSNSLPDFNDNELNSESWESQKNMGKIRIQMDDSLV